VIDYQHKLVCGDCTDPATVARVMGGERADCVVTDPPYGVTREPWDRKLTDSDVSAALSICDGAVLMFGAARPDIVRDVLLLSELPNRIMIWRTTTPKAGSGMFWTWQPIYCWRANFNGWDSLDWQDAPTTTGEHPTQKPVGFMQKLIGMVSGDGAIIYEPFSGSGTTIIACENLARRCRACEISPAYVAVALERFHQHTGVLPVLIG
jgi:DNA modification methylase